jgi:hypothetical protein
MPEVRTVVTLFKWETAGSPAFCDGHCFINFMIIYATKAILINEFSPLKSPFLKKHETLTGSAKDFVMQIFL